VTTGRDFSRAAARLTEAAQAEAGARNLIAIRDVIEAIGRGDLDAAGSSAAYTLYASGSSSG
jgi:hypothetical protein